MDPATSYDSERHSFESDETYNDESRLLEKFDFRGRGLMRRASCRKKRLLVVIFKLALFSVASLAILSILDMLLHPTNAPPAHYGVLEDTIASSSSLGSGNPHNHQVFIASNIINAELIRGHWGRSLHQLIRYLGPENVFLSIYENDSGAETASALRELASEVSCNHSIVYGGSLPLDSFPSVVLPTGEVRVKRLTYLEEVRNRLLWPLDDEGDHQNSDLNHTSVRYDRILFLNDIYFDPMDALHLLFSTNVDPNTLQADYRAACAIDFNTPIRHYDIFVLRDSEGRRPGMPVYPYFGSAGSAESRQMVLSGSDAIPVKSCWGGMVAMQADDFLRTEVLNPTNLKPGANGGDLRGRVFGQSAISTEFIDPRLKSATKPDQPLRFRHQTETYRESSECCLLHADLAWRGEHNDSKIFVNPYIRTFYSEQGWKLRKFVQRYERIFSLSQWILSSIAYPSNNPRRTVQPGTLAAHAEWRYDDSALNGEAMRNQSTIYTPSQVSGRWETVTSISEPGEFCGERSLFVMKPDLKASNTGDSGTNWSDGPFPPWWR